MSPESRLASVTAPRMETRATDTPGRHPSGRPQTPGDTASVSLTGRLRAVPVTEVQGRGVTAPCCPPGCGRTGLDALGGKVGRGGGSDSNAES